MFYKIFCQTIDHNRPRLGLRPIRLTKSLQIKKNNLPIRLKKLKIYSLNMIVTHKLFFYWFINSLLKFQMILSSKNGTGSTFDKPQKAQTLNRISLATPSLLKRYINNRYLIIDNLTINMFNKMSKISIKRL